MRKVLSFFSISVCWPGLAMGAPDAAVVQFQPIPDAGIWAIIIAMNVLVVYGVRQIIRGLDQDPEWTMSRALSESSVVEQSHPTERDSSGQPRLFKAPLPSVSRLIAFLGMVVIMGMFLAIGDVLIWCLGKTFQVPDLEKAQGLLYGGATLFAPYLVNQGKEAIKAFGKQGQ